MKLKITSLAICSLLIASHGAAETEPATTAPSSEYATKVAPILKKYCVGCHNAADREGELSLETFADLRRGGESGAVIVPGRASDSRLLNVLNGRDELKMPPEDHAQPNPAEINLIATWIERGARRPITRPTKSNGSALSGGVAHAEKSTAITSLAASPAGVQYAVGYFQRVELADASDGETFRTLDGLPGKVTALHYSADGRQLVVASGVTGQAGYAAIYSSSDGQLLAEFSGHRDLLYDAELSPDGQLIATCSYDRKIILWETASGKVQRTLEGHNDAVYDIAFSPDGGVLASASGDETVKLWQVATGQRLDTLSQPQAEQYVVRFSPDGRFVLAGGADNRIRAWHFVSKTEQRINPLAFARFAHDGAVVDLAFMADGRNLVSAAADHSLKQWETATLNETHRFRQQTDQTTGLAILRDTNEVLVAQIDGAIVRLPLGPTSLASAVADQPAERQEQATAATTSENRLAEHEPNDVAAEAMDVYLPARIEGEISAKDGSGFDADCFRFKSLAGQEWVLETLAAREESLLDSYIEVLSESGQPIERVLLQATRDSYFTFRGKDSSGFDDFRLHNWQEMELNEYLYANGEVVKLWHYPRGPDSGFQVYPGKGKRYGFFDTTPIAHALQEPCYVVEPRRPGSPLISNGLPVFTLYFENDDESHRELGADSRLHFKAPHDGEFIARVVDVRGFGGPDYHYELTIRPRRPDFGITVQGKDPTLNRGSGKEFSVEAKRSDGFEGEIELEVDNLPPGFHASTPLVIERGQNTALGSVYADLDAVAPSGDSASAVSIKATAIVAGKRISKEGISFGTLKLAEERGVEPSIVAGTSDFNAEEPLVLTIVPGETITATVRIERNGFAGRVGFGTADAGRNLPHGVYVDNIGLNGLLIVEGQDEREFFITAADWVPETKRLFHLRTESEGNVTTRPVWLHVRRSSSAE